MRFSDESGLNFKNVVKPTQYDGRSEYQMCLNPDIMMVKVILNQDSILDFPKCPHVLSICHLKYHSWISVYFFYLQADWLVT